MRRASRPTTLEVTTVLLASSYVGRKVLRRCTLSRAVLPKERMVRFVVGPDHTLVADLAERLPGRGIWLKAEGDMLEAARMRGELARVIGRRSGAPVVIPSDLRERLVAGFGRRIAELLGATRRAGQAVTGAEDLQALHASGRAGLLLAATDATERERAHFPDAVVAGLSRAAFGAIFECGPLAHVGVRRGRLAATIESAALRRLRLAATDGVTETV